MTRVVETPFSREQLQEMANSIEFWWHSINLGHGVTTNGVKTPRELARELDSLCLPSLAGKTVLDVGAYDGFYSFEAENRGAARVVALDHFVWSLDLPGHIRHWRECKEHGVTPKPVEETPYWQPAILPGKKGFDVAHRALNSNVEAVVDDYMTIDVSDIGAFDVVLYLGVLYHMQNPLAALRRIASLTKHHAIIETHAVLVPKYESVAMWEFYPSNELNGDVSNWWGPNLKALEGLCRAAGFARTRVVADFHHAHRPSPLLADRLRTAAQRAVRGLRLRKPRRQSPLHYRAVVHAWK